MDKRQFIKSGMTGMCGLCLLPQVHAGKRIFAPADDRPWKWSKEASHYTITPRGTKCMICPNECLVRSGETSVCRNRINYKDKLYTIGYGNPCAAHVDPIEKKPLLHFLPSTFSYSISIAGCNFTCLNCQNWNISQASPYDTNNLDLMPSRVIDACLSENCHSISYTYSEPISFYEYMFDTAKLARERHIKNVMVSNGYIHEKPLRELCQYIDAANIDLKAFDDDIYLKLTGGKLQPILQTLQILKQEGVWLEITHLIVPSWTDDLDMIKRMCEWLVNNNLGDCPIHFLKFRPMYQLSQLPPTPANILQKAKEIAQGAGCQYVYLGNVSDPGAMSVVCPKCKTTVIERKGYSLIKKRIENGKCENCKSTLPGVW